MDGPVVLHAAEVDAPRAVVDGPVQLLDSLVHDVDRQDAGPAQAAVRLAPDVGHPSVVTLAHGDLDLVPLRELHGEDGGVEELVVDAELVHVAQPGADVEHVPRGGGRDDVASGDAGEALKLFAGTLLLFRCARQVAGFTGGPADPAVDEPVTLWPAGSVRDLHDDRAEVLVRGGDVVPGLLRLDDMGVSVNDSHDNNPQVSIADGGRGVSMGRARPPMVALWRGRAGLTRSLPRRAVGELPFGATASL